MNFLNKKCYSLILLFLVSNTASLFAQKENINIRYSKDLDISVTHATFLGKTSPLRNLVPIASTSLEKRKKNKANRKEVKNFSGRSLYSSVNPVALPDGTDPILQTSFNNTFTPPSPIEPLLNIDGMDANISLGDPPDPTLDVGKDYILQLVNATFFQIRDKSGIEITEPISANTIWSQVGLNSAGDPIVLYDQEADRWIITEFSIGNILLFAITESNDPLGSWMVWSFSSPNFPDYPKYSIWSNAYCLTTNENGSGLLPNYFIDRAAILNGEPLVAIQRITVPGVTTGPGFQVASPVDWSGINPPPSGAKPMVLSLNDDAWSTNSQDQISLHSFDIDWDTPSNTTFTTTNIITSPFDTNPCTIEGSGFECIPQLNGPGLDGLPAVIMNQVHYRNFGSHESIVLSFITDATGTNVSGIRWIELRRINDDWILFQEGTLAPNDELHRFMPAICMDGSGNIGLAYNISGDSIYAGIRFTGRYESDPLGVMTVDEYNLVDGQSSVGPRFGDYNHMSIDPVNDRTFWFTAEYAGSSGWASRIGAFELMRDENDIGPISLQNPETASDLTTTETIEIEIKNFGLEPQNTFTIGYIFEENPAVTESVNLNLFPDSTYTHVFSNTENLSAFDDYDFKIFTSLQGDDNILNDSLNVIVRKAARLDIGISNIIGLEGLQCGGEIPIDLILTNYGSDTISSANIDLMFNSMPLPQINWTGSLASGDSESIAFTLNNSIEGNNNLTALSSSPNGELDQDSSNDLHTRSFDVDLGGLGVTLQLLTDSFPEETTWDLVHPNGNILASGGPYSEEAFLYEIPFCLDTALCYTFNIYDAFGDGICCNNGAGNYTIINEDGGILLAGTGIFSDQETNEFCTDFACALSADIFFSQENGSGASDATLLIEPINGSSPFQYSIDGGASFVSSNFFFDLQGGVYEIIIIDANECTYEETITIPTCAINIITTVIHESEENASDGQISISVANAMDPIFYSIDNGDTFQESSVFENLPADTYNIIVKDGNNCEATIQVTIDLILNITDQTFGYHLLVFPNPSKGLFRVEVKGVQQSNPFLKYDVIDQKGQIIQSSQLTLYNNSFLGQLSLVDYPDGVYFIRFKNSNIKQLLKVLKQR